MDDSNPESFLIVKTFECGNNFSLARSVLNMYTEKGAWMCSACMLRSMGRGGRGGDAQASHSAKLGYGQLVRTFEDNPTDWSKVCYCSEKVTVQLHLQGTTCMNSSY